MTYLYVFITEGKREVYKPESNFMENPLAFVLNSKDQKEDYTTNKSNITEFLGLLLFTQVL